MSNGDALVFYSVYLYPNVYWRRMGRNAIIYHT